mgnify:CR=1 FL=1
MNALNNINKNVCLFLTDISNKIDSFIDNIIGISIKSDDCKEENKTSYDKNNYEKDDYNKLEKSSIEKLNKLIKIYPGFKQEPFSFPKRLGHMDLEIVKVKDDDMFRLSNNFKTNENIVIDSKTGEKKSFITKDPAIATSFNRKLDNHNATMLIGMRDCFSFIRELKFEMDMGFPKEQAEEALTCIVGRIMKETGWSFEQVLLAILMRDVILPTVVSSSARSFENMHDTIRLYYSSGESCRWAIVPYHSPSLDIGKLVFPGDKDFPNEEFGENDADENF